MSSDEDESIEIDCDTCGTFELNQLFDSSFRIASEEAFSLEKDYALYIDATKNFDRVAVATSNQIVHLFDLGRSKGFTELQRYNTGAFTSKNELPICGIRFAKNNPSSIYIGEDSGNIYLYDIRTKPTHVQTFHNDKIVQKPFTCIDINADDTILCAGTENTVNETHLVLFDIRKWSPLTVYTDTHSDTISQVKFHPNKSNLLATGAMDGLINVFDVEQMDEDDALEYSLNVENGVQTINWHENSHMQTNDDNDSSSLLSCITDTNDFHLFDNNETELMFQCERSKITELLKRKVANDCYLVNCHNASNGDIFLLAGSNFNDGVECLRSLTVQIHDKSFTQRNNFNENKQIVRCSIFNEKDNVLITAGEGGIVTVWDHFETANTDSRKLKEKVNTKSNRKSKPY